MGTNAQHPAEGPERGTPANESSGDQRAAWAVGILGRVDFATVDWHGSGAVQATFVPGVEDPGTEAVVVRNQDKPEERPVVLTHLEWTQFIDGVMADEFTIPETFGGDPEAPIEAV